MEFTNSLARDASHVLVNKTTGEAILETFLPLASLPTPKPHLEWQGIRAYLASLNNPTAPAYAWARRSTPAA